MLKKAGIVVAAATAGLLAVSPMAFASGLISIDDNAVQVPVQACGNDIVAGVVGVLAKDLENNSDDETDCDQENSAENSDHNDD
ncbi:MAG: hypothetical protein ACT4O0_10300 [Pseudonocardia sp.]